MSRILIQHGRDSRPADQIVPANASLLNVKAENQIIQEVFVGSSRKNSYLFCVPSVLRTHLDDPVHGWVVRFEYRLNGAILMTKTFASDKHGACNKPLSEGAAYIGKVKNRKLK
jgi:hypothetical protein